MPHVDRCETHWACPLCRDGRCHCHHCSEYRETTLRKEASEANAATDALRDRLKVSEREVDRLRARGPAPVTKNGGKGR